jgi:signal transduction histidine kinase
MWCKDGPVTVAAPSGATARRSGPRAWTDRRLPLILLPVALVVSLLAELSLANAGVGTDGILTDAASGFAFVLAGLIAWRRRPDNRVGPIMTGIGLAWFGGDFLFAPVPLIGPLSLAAQAAARVLFAWLLLAFPSGRLDSDLHRWAVGLIAAVAVALAAIQVVTLDPADLCACPASPFAFAAGTELAEQLPNIAAVVGIGMTVILVPLVVRRALVASGPARRTLVPVLAGGAFSLLSVTPTLITDLTDISVEPISWLPIVWMALPIGFLIALLNARMARGVVADLVIRLGETPAPEHLREALATALHDPSLEVVRWSAEAGDYVGAEGLPATLPAADSARTVTVLEGERGRLGAIIHDPALLEDPGLVASVGAAMRLAVENEHLQAEVEAQLAEVRASRARIVTAGDAERRRLERDLHDGAQQRLVALSLALRRARSRVEPASDEGLAASLDDAADLVRDALAELRELARGIHPAVLTEAGLAGALPVLARSAPVAVTLEAVPGERLPADIEAAAYFLVSEALANVAKHASDAAAVVRVRVADGVLGVEVADDGPGGATAGQGSGLQGLDDRVAALGGRLEIHSPLGHGTTLRAWIPMPGNVEARAESGA